MDRRRRRNKGEVEKEGGSSDLFSHPALDESEYRGKRAEERSDAYLPRLTFFVQAQYEGDCGRWCF